MGGVFLGVSALIVVLAVMTGFQDGIRDKIISANPHILIMEAGGRGVADGGGARRAGARRSRACVSATPFVLQQALFTAPGRRRDRRAPARGGPRLARGPRRDRGADHAAAASIRCSSRPEARARSWAESWRGASASSRATTSR